MGTDPGKTEGAVKGSIQAGSLTIEGKAAGDTSVTGIGVSAGGVAVNAAVALAIGNANNIALLNRMPVTLSRQLALSTSYKGEVETLVVSLAAGGVAVGATVAVGSRCE